MKPESKGPEEPLSHSRVVLAQQHSILPERRLHPAAFELVEMPAQLQIIPKPRKDAVLIGKQRRLARACKIAGDRFPGSRTVAQSLDNPLRRDRIVCACGVAYGEPTLADHPT